MKEAVIRGKVQQGDKRGRQMGFPTANLRLHKDISDGVYISETKIGEQWYPSVTSIGAAKTFDKAERKCETHIFDFSGNLYNQWISVRLIKKIRGMKRFESMQELMNAMHNDAYIARTHFQHG